MTSQTAATPDAAIPMRFRGIGSAEAQAAILDDVADGGYPDAAIPMRFRSIGSAEAQAAVSGPPNAVVVERR